MALSQAELDRQKEYQKLREEGNITGEQAIELLRIEAKLQKEINQSAQEAFDKAKETHEEKKKLGELLGIEVDLTQEQVELDAAVLAVLKEELIAHGEITEENRAQVEHLREQIKEQDTLVQGSEKRAEVQAKYNTQVENAGDLAIQLGNSIGLAANYQGSLLGKMDSTLTMLGDSEEAQAKFTAQLKETFSAANLFSSAFEKILEMSVANAMAYDGAATSFNAATGAAGEYNDAIQDASRGHTALGVTTEGAGAAMAALHANMSSFTTLTKAEATTLGQGTAQLEKLGISAATTGKTLDNLAKHMGMSADAALDQAKQMAEFASGIGVAPAKMAEDFAAATPLMVKYGTAGTTVFKNLAKTAKSTGIEMSALLGIAEQFDTFEGAATAAGKLNAMLGGPLLNSVELLTASEDERIAMMRDAVAQSGKSWESMNKFEKQSLMAAAGISDLDQAGRLFGENSEEVAEEQKNLNDMIAKSIPVMEKLKAIAMNLAIMMGPIVDKISEWATGITEWMDENEDMVQGIGKLIMVLGGLLLLWKGFVAVMKIHAMWTRISAAATFGQAAANLALGTSSAPAAGGIIIIGQAAKVGWKEVVAFGFAILMIGTSIAIVLLALVELAGAMKGMGAESIALVAILLILVAGFYLMIGALAGIAAVGIVAVPVLLAIGFAMLSIGISIGLIILTIVLLVDSITKLFKLFIDNAAILPQVATGIAMIGVAMLVLAGAAFLMGLGFPVIVAGFGALALGVLMFAAALAFVKTEDLQAMADLGKAMSDMSVSKSVAFQASMEGFEAAVGAADGAGLDVLVGAADFIKLAGVIPVPGKEEKPVPVIIKGSTGTGGTSGGAGPTTVKLYLNEREFATAVIKVMDKKLNLSTA